MVGVTGVAAIGAGALIGFDAQIFKNMWYRRDNVFKDIIPSAIAGGVGSIPGQVAPIEDIGQSNFISGAQETISNVGANVLSAPVFCCLWGENLCNK